MKLKFIHITKTGGTSIENIAKENGIYWGRYDQDLKFLGSVFWHIPFQFCERNSEKNRLIDNFEFFVVVRNPYDRCVSEYFCPWGGPRDNKRTKKQMNQYISMKMIKIINDGEHNMNTNHFMPQFRYVYDEKGNRIVKNILKFENLKEEFDRLMVKYGIPLALNSHDNYSNKNLSANDLDESTIKLIQKVYEKDFIEFFYDK